MTNSPSWSASLPALPTLPAIRAERARRNLLAFAQLTFPRYRPAPHHMAIAEKLEAVERGEIDRLMIFMPPRHGKTELASIRFPAWYLGRNPDRRVIGASYAAALSYRISRQARNIVNAVAWPFEMRLAEDLANVAAWDLGGHRGGYIAAGVGGPITGSGAHLLIIDDPVKNQEEADSPVIRQNVWEWYTSTAYTRLEDAAAVVLIQTRWHHDDLAGRLLQAQAEGGDKWEVLHLPALDAEGAALWPEKYDTDALLRIKGAVGTRVFEALYQGRPSNDESALFKRHWWKYYTEPPETFDEIIQSWDMAFKDTKTADFVVGQVWGRQGANKYLLDQVRDRLSFTATLRAVESLSQKWPQAILKLVEDKANGPAVIDTLKNTLTGLVAVNPEGGKEARASAVSPQVEAGNVWLPAASRAPWVQSFVQECSDFPTGANDDQVDAMTQALHRLASVALPFGWLREGA